MIEKEREGQKKRKCERERERERERETWEYDPDKKRTPISQQMTRIESHAPSAVAVASIFSSMTLLFFVAGWMMSKTLSVKQTSQIQSTNIKCEELSSFLLSVVSRDEVRGMRSFGQRLRHSAGYGYGIANIYNSNLLIYLAYWKFRMLITIPLYRFTRICGRLSSSHQDHHHLHGLPSYLVSTVLINSN